MSANVAPNTVRSGLVLDLDAANLKSYAGSGTSWVDLTSNGNNGVLTNGPTFSSANGGSIVFDGSNDYVGLVKNLSMALNSFTISTWFSTTQNADSKIFSNNLTSHPLGTYFGKLRSCTVGGCTEGSQVINDGLWRLATIVGDAVSIRVYINDSTTPDITRPASSTVLNTIPNIGTVGDGGSSYNYGGKISSMVIYNRALSAAEILQNYNALKSRFGL